MKRSSGSARVGKCLFINEELFKPILKFSSGGITLKKGQEVALEGSWRTGSYEKDGVKIYTNEMFISNFSFIGGQAAGNNSAPVQDNNTGFDGMTPVYDSDMPF